MSIKRTINKNHFFNKPNLIELGLDYNVLKNALTYTYKILDKIDNQMIESDEPRISELIELANLSAIIGNLFRSGIAKYSNGKFIANGPHKYPDLLSTDENFDDLELKVALETNKPKGHLVKPGPHLTIRYVLGDENSNFTIGKENRGNVPWIWEIRAGNLISAHFNVSNTAGDSGKTAVINKEGMVALKVSYCDIDKCPYSVNSKTYKSYLALSESK